MNKRLCDLAYQFRNSKIWKRVCEDELFAVPLDDGSVAYCEIAGSEGEDRALTVYIGARESDAATSDKRRDRNRRRR